LEDLSFAFDYVVHLQQACTNRKARRAKLINIDLPWDAKVYLISLQFGRNSGTTINYPKSDFCSIFRNWGSFVGRKKNSSGPNAARGPYFAQAW